MHAEVNSFRMLHLRRKPDSCSPFGSFFSVWHTVTPLHFWAPSLIAFRKRGSVNGTKVGWGSSEQYKKILGRNYINLAKDRYFDYTTILRIHILMSSICANLDLRPYSPALGWGFKKLQVKNLLPFSGLAIFYYMQQKVLEWLEVFPILLKHTIKLALLLPVVLLHTAKKLL